MKYICLFLTFLIFSCSSYKNDFSYIQCSTIGQIIQDDQSIRFELNDNTDFFGIKLFPEIKGEKNHNKRGFLTRKLFISYLRNEKDIELSLINFERPLNRKIAMEFLEKQIEIYERQAIIDSSNLRKVKSILKKYGYPNENRFKEKCDQVRYFYVVILHFIQDKEIDSLIQAERKLGRFPEKQYHMLAQRKKSYKKAN